MGNANFTAAPSGTFRTGGGPINIAANEDKQYAALCDVVRRPDLKADGRFADRHARKAHREALTAELEAALAARGAAEWEELLVRAGVPAGRVLTVPEIVEHPQVRGRGFVAEMEAPEGRQRVTRCGFRFGDGNPAPSGPAPALSAQTEVWLERLGYGGEDIRRLKDAKVI
jgi:crotonobetainyl-CoA:carnitine CoA-transferase CaiB-like acyl-CoA transferase